MFGGTGLDAIAENGVGVGDGCPISGAEVCLKDVFAGGAEAEALCVESDLDGLFSAPAVIGTTVVIEIKYENHTFAALDPTQQATYDAGIAIDPDRYYTGFNFKDITTSNLNVEVAGGLCDRLIGKATLEFKILGCTGWLNTPTQVRGRGRRKCIGASNFSYYPSTFSRLSRVFTKFRQPPHSSLML